MEQNFLDEIFSQINLLETENKVLQEELNNINSESVVKIDKFIQNHNNDTNLTENINKIKKFDFELLNKKKSYKKNLEEILINFKPYDELDSIEIIGDFTNWKKIKIEKVTKDFLIN